MTIMTIDFIALKDWEQLPVGRRPQGWSPMIVKGRIAEDDVIVGWRAPLASQDQT